MLTTVFWGFANCFFCDFLLVFQLISFYIYIWYLDLEVVGILSLHLFKLLDYVSVHCGFFLYSSVEKFNEV